MSDEKPGVDDVGLNTDEEREASERHAETGEPERDEHGRESGSS